MVTTKRIQRRRVKGWRMPEGAVSVTRPGVFGNPFVVGPDMTAEMAVRCYREWLVDGECYLIDGLKERRARLLARLPELVGKDLACYCAVDAEHCHADVLLEMTRKVAP
jgi:hypothetical protein